jgi:protein-disulfide isomerase
MKPKRRRAKAHNTSATWWIVGLMAIMAVIGLIALNGLPQAARQRAQTSGVSQGAADAPIVLEEYADFQCPACRLFAVQTLRQIEERYVATDSVRVEFHHFAFIGEESIRAGEAAECAGEQGAFWPYYDTLFANQGGENVGAFSDARLLDFATQLSLDTGAFQTCMAENRYRAKVVADTADGRARGVRSTPTLFINGRVEVGALSLAQFEAIIEPLLNTAQ